MEKVKQILEKVLNGLNLSTSEILYLQEHQKEVKETHNIELIEFITNTGNEPNFKFNKILYKAADV